MVAVMRRKEVVEEAVIIGGLIVVQLAIAGNAVFMSYIMSHGLKPYTLVIFSSLATFFILSPLAVIFERSHWPKKLCFNFLLQLAIISFSGVTLFQTLLLKGIKLTSPAMATAMPNLAPGFIFFIAWFVGLEKVNFSSIYSKVKILGTLLCVAGAITMSIIHSTAAESKFKLHEITFDKQKMIGCLYLLAAVLLLSSNVVLQAAVLGEFPAPISLAAITSLIGVPTTVIAQLVTGGGFDSGWELINFKNLIAFSILVGAIGGACVSFSGWAMKKRGPVVVAMFNPIATVCSVVLSFITLGDTIKLGSVGGMFLMFVGLYCVLWAKGKEIYSNRDTFATESAQVAPLLKTWCDGSNGDQYQTTA